MCHWPRGSFRETSRSGLTMPAGPSCQQLRESGGLLSWMENSVLKLGSRKWLCPMA